MKNPKALFGGLALAVLLCSSWQVARAEGQTTTLRGYVLDSACAFTKSLKKPISAECALVCAKAGSPLVILADDGEIYWPISGVTPARSENAKLLEFAGRRVSVKGTLYQRGGSHAVVITSVEAAK